MNLTARAVRRIIVVAAADAGALTPASVLADPGGRAAPPPGSPGRAGALTPASVLAAPAGARRRPAAPVAPAR